MAEGHSHNHGRDANARQLGIALTLTGSFLVVEVIYGLLSGSLALLSDAGHMLTDVAALALSLFAIRMGQRPADRRRTFGYRRTEILAAAVNAGALFAIGIYILFEAYRRLNEPVDVQTTPMLIVATLGLIVNVISARVLVGGSEGSLNMKSAYLEVMGDLLGSVAVIIGALLIRFTGLTWIDPVLGAAIGLWVLPRTWTLLKASVNVLMEGVPDGLDLDALRAAIAGLPEEPEPDPRRHADAADDALSAAPYRAFSQDFARARLPVCLHSEGLRNQPTFFLSGVLALPFVAVAKVRGVCR